MRKHLLNRLNPWNERKSVRKNINWERMSYEAHSSRTAMRMRPCTCKCAICEALKYKGKLHLSIVNW